MLKHNLSEFLGEHITILERDGQRWMTAEQVGRALGYNEANARIGVQNLYNRHADEFTEADACVIKLMTGSRGEQITRIFSATGCVLLSFFSGTPRAARFRVWAKEVLANAAAPHSTTAVALPSPAPRKRIAYITRALERQVLELFADGWKQRDIAEHLNLSAASINLLVHGKYPFAPGAGESQCTPELIEALAYRHYMRARDELLRVQQCIAMRLRSTANNTELAAALDAVGQHLQLRHGLPAMGQPHGGMANRDAHEELRERAPHRRHD
jgi:prophage antirepressor-like protein